MENKHPPTKAEPVDVEEEPSLPGMDMPIGSSAELDPAPVSISIAETEDAPDATDPIVARRQAVAEQHQQSDLDHSAASSTTDEISLTLSHTAPPAPDPTPSFLPSEIAGMILGGLFLLLGLTYVFWIL